MPVVLPSPQPAERGGDARAGLSGWHRITYWSHRRDVLLEALRCVARGFGKRPRTFLGRRSPSMRVGHGEAALAGQASAELRCPVWEALRRSCGEHCTTGMPWRSSLGLGSSCAAAGTTLGLLGGEGTSDAAGAHDRLLALRRLAPRPRGLALRRHCDSATRAATTSKAIVSVPGVA
jgi:hypothetical protein